MTDERQSFPRRGSRRLRVGRWFLGVVAAALVCSIAAPARAANRYDPTLRFRTIRTVHFDIHAHQGEEAMAKRLAGLVERVRQQFEPALGVPRGRVQVILVDQTDLSNGFATPVPYNTIEITAVPPTAETLIGNTTDWLELVFTHEYTHILHLDRSRGFVEGVRRVFGRVPVVFPNSFLPIWQIEGLAVFEESRMTGEGRIPAGDFRALVDVAAAHDRFEPMDRVSGGLTAWPGGNGDYAYGAYFHQFLADRFGAERLSRLADATAGRVPFFGAPAFKKVFGSPVGELWRDFRDARERSEVPSSETDRRSARLTHDGFVVTAARRADDGAIYYGAANPHGFPALMRLPRDGVPQRIAWRALGDRTSVRGNWVVFDQLEFVRSVGLVSDLYAVRADGEYGERLTRNARAAAPDLSPDGKQIVCTVQAIGRRALALLDFRPFGVSTPTVIVDDPDADFNGPRWSPDGRSIVAERRRSSGYELVLIDPASHAVRPLVARRDVRLVTPSWTSDGATVLFAANPGDDAFNIFAVDVASGGVRQVTDTVGGAQFPELAPDGLLTYVGYTVDGHDLFSVQTDRARWMPVGFSSERAPDPQASAAPVSDAASATLQRYNAFRTLAPTYWTPIIERDAGETVIGAGTAMSDALGRHSYAADAGWAGGRGRPDWHASYAYDRWRPTLFVDYSDDTDPIRGGLVRAQDVFAGALLAFRHIRRTETLLAGFDAETDTVTCTAECRPRDARRDLRSIRGGWLHDSRRIFGYSISPEEGFALEASAEKSPTALGSDVDAGAAIVDARVFQRIFGRHTVLAARAATAVGWGDVAGRRVFSAAGPGPSNAVFDFGRDSVGLLRGFAPEDVIGSRVFVANLDLRFPLARIERGLGGWPIFFHTVHAAVFGDAGNAWDTTFRTADVRTSTGGELSLDAVVAHYVRVTLAGGAAWTRDPTTDSSRGAIFGRIGYAF